MGEDPTMCLDWVAQFFGYQQSAKDQKVTLAAFHLEGEANRWWHQVKKVYHQEQLPNTREIFEKEILAYFGSSEYEDFDEALSRIKQLGTLREYTKEFKLLAN